MLQLIYILALFFFFFIGASTNSKHDRLLPILLCLYLILLMGGQTSNPDYDIYVNIFNGPFYSKDPGFGALVRILAGIGFDQSNFRLAIAIVGFLLMSVTVFKLLDNRSLFYLFYAVYPFLYDVVQARNFIVMTLLVFSIPLLINSTAKKKVIFICLMLFAATFQKIAIVYIPLAFVDNIRTKKIAGYFSRIIIALSILVAFSKNTVLRIINQIIIPIFGNVHELTSYNKINTKYGWILFWFEQFAAYGMIYYAMRIENNSIDGMLSNATASESSKIRFQYRFLSLTQDINFYLFLFLPLFILDENYTRIIRNVIPINIMAIIIVLTKHKKKIVLTKNRAILLLSFLAYQLLLFAMLYKSYFTSIVMPTFFDNWIFKV